MSKESSTATSGGLGLTSILTIVFVVLKVTGTGAVAHWSWLWVLSPLWISAALTFGGLALYLVLAGLVHFVLYLLGGRR